MLEAGVEGAPTRFVESEVAAVWIALDCACSTLPGTARKSAIAHANARDRIGLPFKEKLKSKWNDQLDSAANEKVGILAPRGEIR